MPLDEDWDDGGLLSACFFCCSIMLLSRLGDLVLLLKPIFGFSWFSCVCWIRDMGTGVCVVVCFLICGLVGGAFVDIDEIFNLFGEKPPWFFNYNIQEISNKNTLLQIN